MNCPQCGTKVVYGAAFCHVCGGSLAFKGQNPPASAADAVPASPVRPRTSETLGDSNDQEEMIWEGRYSKLAMIGYWIFAGTITILLLITAIAAQFGATGWMWTMGVIAAVWMALLLRLIYMQLTVKYSLTTQRFIHERGLLWRHVDRIEAIDIDDVTVEQGPVERLLGIGTVKLASSDQSTPLFPIVGIENVRQVATMIDDARRQERRKRGLYVESV